MATYKFVVLTNAKPGEEAAYHRWYDEVHLGDVLDVPGFVSAQRFEIANAADFSGFRFLAIYEIESDDPQATLAGLMKRAGTAAMVISPAMDPKASTSLWRAITPVVKPSAR
jgi:hypothetical protein